MTALKVLAVMIIFVNVFAITVCILATRRDNRFTRFANKAIDLTGGQR